MNDFTHPLDTVFDTAEPTPLGVQAPAVVTPNLPAVVATTDEEQEKQFQADFEDARGKMRNAMETVEHAMTELSMLAQSAQDPKGFKVVGELADSMANLSKTLMEMHKQRRGGSAPAQGDDSLGGGVSVENAVFVGSTADFMALNKSGRT